MNKVNGGFSEGFKIKSGKNLTIKNKQTKDKNIQANSYPNGIIPFIFITLFFIISTSCIFGIGFSKFYPIFSQKQVWTNSLMCLGIIPLLFNTLWLIGRTGFANAFSFSLLKFSRSMKLSKLRQKLEFYVYDHAVNDVNNFEEYKEFSKTRSEKAKKWFIISFITYSILAILLLIIGLVIQFT